MLPEIYRNERVGALDFLHRQQLNIPSAAHRFQLYARILRIPAAADDSGIIFFDRLLHFCDRLAVIFLRKGFPAKHQVFCRGKFNTRKALRHRFLIVCRHLHALHIFGCARRAEGIRKPEDVYKRQVL